MIAIVYISKHMVMNLLQGGKLGSVMHAKRRHLDKHSTRFYAGGVYSVWKCFCIAGTTSRCSLSSCFLLRRKQIPYQMSAGLSSHVLEAVVQFPISLRGKDSTEGNINGTLLTLIPYRIARGQT